MKKILLVLLLISMTSLFSEATVQEFFGKVKVKYDGDTSWSRIEVGQTLPPNCMVSTGFNSQIVLDLGNARLDVLPLTRMTISEITESQDTIKTALFLQGGKIKADVGKIKGKVNDFKIKSPVATASVRGTAFEFTGNTLTVLRGEVSFKPTKKEDTGGGDATAGEEDEESEEAESEAEGGDTGGVAVKAGGQSQMSSPGVAPVKPRAMAAKATTVSASTKPVVVKVTAAAAVTSVEAVQEVVPTPASGLEAVKSSTTSVTITINVKED